MCLSRRAWALCQVNTAPGGLNTAERPIPLRAAATQTERRIGPLKRRAPRRLMLAGTPAPRAKPVAHTGCDAHRPPITCYPARTGPAPLSLTWKSVAWGRPDRPKKATASTPPTTPSLSPSAMRNQDSNSSWSPDMVAGGGGAGGGESGEGGVGGAMWVFAQRESEGQPCLASPPPKTDFPLSFSGTSTPGRPALQAPCAAPALPMQRWMQPHSMAASQPKRPPRARTQKQGRARLGRQRLPHFFFRPHPRSHLHTGLPPPPPTHPPQPCHNARPHGE